MTPGAGSVTLPARFRSGLPDTPMFDALAGADARQVLERERRHLTRLTEYAPGWVPIGVALALGLGTMIGWKRIVVTVGEKIGERPMSYTQGTSAQLVTAGTILAADVAGAPVSTTHILSSAVAGPATSPSSAPSPFRPCSSA